MNTPDLNKTAKFLQVSMKDMRLIAEAYRRKWFLNAENCWLGLGRQSEYGKSNYFARIHSPNPPHLEWWQLSAEGKAIMEKLEKVWQYHKYKRYNTRQTINQYLFEHA